MPHPKIVIVGEAPLSANLSGTGQTIYNLFLGYPSENVFSYVSVRKKNLFGAKDVKAFFSVPFRNKVLVYDAQLFKPLHNFLGSIINSRLGLINIQFQQWFFKLPKFDSKPDLVIICPNEEEGMLQGYLTAKHLGVPFVIYLMDDWMGLSNLRWIGNDTQSLTKKVLKESQGWVMISTQLKDILAQRYLCEPRSYCVAHNPVTCDNKPYKIPDLNKVQKVVYAGSIWPMHYDSLLIVAQAIHLLAKEGMEVELVVYTFEHFWDKYKDILMTLGVRFGGRVGYSDLHPLLQEGDLLLVTSTFGEQYKSHSLSSLQTKVTDYMLAGRAILACGPSYAACNLFVKQWQCGELCETTDIEEAKLVVKNLLLDKERLANYGRNGYDSVNAYFNSDVMCGRLYRFLDECLLGNNLAAN